MYLWCKIRQHQIVKHNFEVGHWCGCLDCRKQWTYYGSIGSIFSRPLDEYAEITVKAELLAMELPPLWQDFGHDKVVAEVRRKWNSVLQYSSRYSV